MEYTENWRKVGKNETCGAQWDAGSNLASLMSQFHSSVSSPNWPAL